MKWAFLIILLAGCTQPLPLEEISDVHVWLAEWSYEVPDNFYTDTSFKHCGDARVFPDGTGELWNWEGATPTEIMINRLAAGSDHVSYGNEEGYRTTRDLRSPIDGHRYGVNMIQWNSGVTRTDTRMVQHGEGHMVEITETVTLTKLGAVSMKIDRNQYPCD